MIPIREGILFPHTESVLTFGRSISLKGIAESNKTKHWVVLVAQKSPQVKNPEPQDLFQIGTLAVIERTLKTEDSISALVRGLGRVRIDTFIQLRPSMIARVTKLEDKVVHDEELAAMVSHLQKTFRQTIQLGKPVEFINFMRLLGGVSEGELADQVASTLSIETNEKQNLLENLNVNARLKSVLTHLTREIKVLEIEKDVVQKTQSEFDKHMRESVLRERLRTIQKELGEVDDDEELAEEFELKLKKLKLKPDIKDRIAKEIRRLKQMSPSNPESGYVRSWLDVVFDLPWNKYRDTKFNLKKAASVLEKNHFGLKEVKERILEYMAALWLKQIETSNLDKTSLGSLKKSSSRATAAPIGQRQNSDSRVPTILCFVGPPGVGKTSIGRSIAEALGRSFVKISLGGIHDEAEIRGHRRTYVGAMVGRIIKGIVQAKSMNPVFMLDEVDKIGNDFRGDPSSALLEVLDPEQNHAFEDHYLDFPFNLSDVLFITTANTLNTIPPALRDRLEIIEYTGYTHEEKLHIAQDHLWEKVVSANGLKPNQINLSESMLKEVIQRYTHEAGVRDLERQLSTLSRKVARQVVESKIKIKSVLLTKKRISEFLGPEEYDLTATEAKDQVGLATGLAWTSVGGEVLFIEVAITPGKGTVKLTGKLGDVMKESAQAALTYVRANAKKLGIPQQKIDESDIHIHIPEGAVPKDGPSAGITMTTAVVSALTNRAVRRDVAMTGEVTLRGRVLRIGGLKEKAIAAHRAGTKTIIIPADNQRDLVKLPDSVKKDITFKPVEKMSQVLKVALC
ncbi:MAG: Lon protease [Parcubacteria group bacterium GW2011_GWF2_44_8]|nr:MAG: Lon protease [Parcubacteria group bacterium GW2011_GWF2_44_8]